MKNNALSGIHRLALICTVALIVTVDQWLKSVVENCAEGDVLSLGGATGESDGYQ